MTPPLSCGRAFSTSTDAGVKALKATVVAGGTACSSGGGGSGGGGSFPHVAAASDAEKNLPKGKLLKKGRSVAKKCPKGKKLKRGQLREEEAAEGESQPPALLARSMIGESSDQCR